MTAREAAPDVDQLARSMLRLYGAHDDHDEHGHPGENADTGARSFSKAPDFASDPEGTTLIPM